MAGGASASSVTVVATVELSPVSESVGIGAKVSLFWIPEALGVGDEGGFRFS